MSVNEKKIYFYSAFLITLMVNSAKLMALNPDGAIAKYWQFNIWEYGFQFLYNMLFCLLLIYLNLTDGRYFGVFRKNRQWIKLFAFNVVLMLSAIVLGSKVQAALFQQGIPGRIFGGYLARFLLSGIMVSVIIRLILLMRENKDKDLLNEQLQTAHLQAQLKLLQDQLNPHFLFNTLSGLSAIVRENPQKAQAYIVHLSKIFRYKLLYSGSDMVSLDAELQHLHSYIQLAEMRMEKTVKIEINIGSDLLKKHLPHLSLQPLLENAIKHNSATTNNVLVVNIDEDNGWLVVKNTLQPAIGETEGTGIGLANLSERFKLQTRQDIEIQKTEEHFIVKLPLI